MDLYELLAISEEADNKEIDKAFRQKAKEFHPDKQPDNVEKAKEMFHLIKTAKDLLKDLGLRAEYDHKRQAKRKAKERTEQYDCKRRKLAEDLEAREKMFDSEYEEKKAEKKRQSDIQRVREENLKYFAEFKRKEKEAEEQRKMKVIKEPALLRVRWKSSAEELYDEREVKRIFSKYGDVTVVVDRKKKVALVEFEDAQAAVFAKSNESGLPDSPFKSVKWVGEEPRSQHHKQKRNPPPEEESMESFEERERIVLEQMRRAQEIRDSDRAAAAASS